MTFIVAGVMSHHPATSGRCCYLPGCFTVSTAASLTGTIAGFLLTRSARGALAAAACMAGALAPLTGPFALEGDALQRQLYLGMLPIYGVTAVVLDALLRRSSAVDPARSARPDSGLDPGPVL